MEVILLEKVPHLGGLGDKVSVKSGFGRNYLIPQGKAVFASAENLRRFEERRAELEQQAAERLGAAEARKAQIEALSDGVRVTHKAGDEGRLFGSVGTADIAQACLDAGVEVAKSEVRLPEGPFRFAGEYDVTLHLHSDVDAILKVTVVAE
jgi:large subunit ribosomal protein L9